MARLGMAPTRTQLNERLPRRVTMVMITHIPHLAGYYKDQVRITELSLQSMIKNAGEGLVFDVLVFDQNSCIEWQSRLYSFLDSGYIDNIYFSGHNIGKLAAFHKINGMVDSEIVAFTDDDVLFYPDWLVSSLDLIDNFPADLVTGSPILTRFKWYEKQLEHLKQIDTYKVEKLSWEDYPKDWLEDDALGRGLTIEGYVDIIRNAKEGQIEPYKVFRGELGGWAVGHHMQFTAVRKHVFRHLPIPGRELMGVMREWDVTMDTEGVIQLATEIRTCRHMGNVLDNSIVNDAIKMELVI